MDTWNAQHNYPQEYRPPFQEDQGQMYHHLGPPMMYPMPEPNHQEAHFQGLSREDDIRMKLEKRRERNRQASARYRERKEQLLADLESETKRMEQEVAELEARLQRGLQELALLKAQATGGYDIVLHNGHHYTGL